MAAAGWTAADLIEATKNLRQKSKERPVKWDISHASDPMTAHDRLCIQQHRVRLANRWMTEGNIVRNEKEGDVGVVMDVSYSRHDKPKKGNGKADHIATTSSGAKVHVYMHVKVALPNGKETTWREAQLTALSASDGFREIVSRMTV